jgi:hypothetical protein
VRNGRLEAESDLLDKRALTAIAGRVFALDVDLYGFARSIAGERDLAQARAKSCARRPSSKTRSRCC